ncbi:MAG TPA: hypothetical protein VFL38_17220 [Humibacillus xanthopallidus]|nr:hypothetical protein [Humibacillus xanthopallidus]
MAASQRRGPPCTRRRDGWRLCTFGTQWQPDERPWHDLVDRATPAHGRPDDVSALDPDDLAERAERAEQNAFDAHEHAHGA